MGMNILALGYSCGTHDVQPLPPELTGLHIQNFLDRKIRKVLSAIQGQGVLDYPGTHQSWALHPWFPWGGR